MLIKAAALLLIFFFVLGLFGKWRFPGQKTLAAAKCGKCGRYNIGKGPCPCEKGNP